MVLFILDRRASYLVDRSYRKSRSGRDVYLGLKE